MGWQRMLTRGLAGLFRRSLLRRSANARRRARLIERLRLADAQSVRELQARVELSLGRARRLREELPE